MRVLSWVVLSVSANVATDATKAKPGPPGPLRPHKTANEGDDRYLYIYCYASRMLNQRRSSIYLCGGVSLRFPLVEWPDGHEQGAKSALMCHRGIVRFSGGGSYRRGRCGAGAQGGARRGDARRAELAG